MDRGLPNREPCCDSLVGVKAEEFVPDNGWAGGVIWPKEKILICGEDTTTHFVTQQGTAHLLDRDDFGFQERNGSNRSKPLLQARLQLAPIFIVLCLKFAAVICGDRFGMCLFQLGEEALSNCNRRPIVNPMDLVTTGNQK